MTYDPAFTNTASCRSSIMLHRRRGRRARVPRLSDRAALREVHLPRGGLPPDLRRAADAGASSTTWVYRDHPPHLRPREHQEVRRGLPLRRPPDGDAARHRRRALDLLPGRQEHRRRHGAPHGGRAADREGAHARRLRLPPQPRAALRLSGQRPLLPRQLPLDDVQDDRGRSTSRTRGSSGRSTCSGSCTPTTSRTARRTRCAAVGSSQVDPYSARGRRRGRALRPAARRRQRGGAADARPDRLGGQHPGLPRGREEPQGEADGLRPPRLQELRPARPDHQGARGRGVRGHGQEPEARDRHRAREARPRRRLLHRAQALPERRLLLGADLRGAQPAHRHVHGDVRHPAHVGLDRPVARDGARTRRRRSPGRARSTRASASATTAGRSRRPRAARGPRPWTARDRGLARRSAVRARPYDRCSP